jgi:glycogen(starch) synthase
LRSIHVNHRYAPYVGGSERFVQEVSEHRASLGDDVAVVTSDAFDLEYFWTSSARVVSAPSRERLNGVDVFRTPVRHVPFGTYAFHAMRRTSMILGKANRTATISSWCARALPRLPELTTTLRACGPADLVHVTNLGLEGFALTAADLASNVGAALVVTPFLHLGTGADAYARRHASLAHQRRLIVQADAVLAMTERESAFLQSLGVNGGRVVVTGAGVTQEEVTGGDATAFRRRLQSSALLVGAIGALAPDKGTPELIEAVGHLRRKGVDVELALAGPELSGFTRWFDRLPVDRRRGIHRLGVIDASAKRDMLAAIDVLALPSRTESFGIVYLEAWTNRKPVIAADVGAVSDVVQDGVTGLLVPFGSVIALATAIERYVNDSRLRVEHGMAGQALVLSRYQWPSVLERVDTAYAMAIERRDRRNACE